MKKYKIIAIIEAICLVIVLGTVAFNSIMFKVSAGSSPDTSSNEQLVKTELQREEFIKLGLINGCSTSAFKIAVLQGEVSDDFERMTLQEVKDIIEVNKKDGFDAILKALAERQPWPDSVGGSGVSVTIYGLDDEGMEEILIVHEQADIAYGRYELVDGEKKVVDSEMLYEPPRTTTSEPEKVN